LKIVDGHGDFALHMKPIYGMHNLLPFFLGFFR
jgi:hypothetical protein